MNRQLATPAPTPACSDNYPSRTGGAPAILPRLEPVIHSRDRSSAPLSQAQLAHYELNGFVILKDLFDDTEVRLLQREIEAVRLGQSARPGEYRVHEPGDDTLRSVFAVHRSNPLFSRLAADRRLVDIAQYVLDDEVYIHQSRLNYKPGFRGREFYWHSDFETWHVEDGMPAMRALSVSIALTENTPENGPLMLIPGSHRHFVACSGLTPENHFRRSLRRQEYGVPDDTLLQQLADQGGICAVDAPPGSVIIFDSNTMHGSNSNITPYPRSNAFLVYNALGNRVTAPFCAQQPRPEYICSRQTIAPLAAIDGKLDGEGRG